MRVNLKEDKWIEIEVKQTENGLYEYYIENMKIGVYDPKSMEDKILFLENTLENELKDQIKDDLNSISVQKLDDEIREKKAIDTYVRELGENLQIKQITMLELEEESKGKNEEKEHKEEKKEKVVNKESDVNIKQEINLNEKANDTQTIKQWFGGNIPSDVVKIGVIESYQMDNLKDENGERYKENTTRYDLIAINKKGEVEPLSKYIPQLKQSDASGANPTEKNYLEEADGTVKKRAILSKYEIGNKIIQIANKGKVEVHVAEKKHGGKETVGGQVRDKSTLKIPSIEKSDLLNEHGGQYKVNESIEEVEEHSRKAGKKSDGCEKLKTEDIDGDKETQSHSPLEDNGSLEEKVPENVIKAFLETLGDVYNRKDIEDKIKQVARENRGKTDDEILGQAWSEMDEQANQEHTGPERRR